MGEVEFIEDKVSSLKSWKKRKLNDLVQSMNKGDVLLVPGLSWLGRSLVEVLEVLSELNDKEVKVFSVKENFQLNGDDTQPKDMRKMLGLFTEIERDLISAKIKEGLQVAKASGKRLGRPKGPGKSKLDKHKEEIIALLKNGSKKTFIAERYGVPPATLTNWIRRHGLDKLKPEP